MKISDTKDFWGGILFIAFGLMALIVSSSYPMGTTMHMGPRYFPTLVGGLLVLLGLIIAIKGLATTGEKITGWAPRPLILVLAAVVTFAVMIQPIGLTLATLALVVISCLGGLEFRFRDVIVLSLLLAALTVGIFIYGVGLPLKVWPF